MTQAFSLCRSFIRRPPPEPFGELLRGHDVQLVVAGGASDGGSGGVDGDCGDSGKGRGKGSGNDSGNGSGVENDDDGDDGDSR